jgi:hypothetical protein
VVTSGAHPAKNAEAKKIAQLKNRKITINNNKRHDDGD